MYEGHKISVVLPTYKEKKSIRKVINSFFATKFVDEVVVVNNNAEKGTDAEIKKTLPARAGKARLVYEPIQGYGPAFRRAIKEAKGDWIIVSEPDGTFKGKDLERFLVYAKDYDVVLGTRTSQISAFSGFGMGIVRKFANVIEAKTIEVLFNSVALTDVGCAYKLFKKSSLKKIMPLWSNTKSALFNTELVLLTVSLKIPFVEIPITYQKRVGKSSVVGNWYHVIKWAIIIQTYIFYFWIKYLILKKDKHKQ
ncbi:MAG: glycosyltransferase [Candidatus Woesebacteria bacterium]|nr:MAG: glycosyltransferase [Candidatus Woesebacteria bacterium]